MDVGGIDLLVSTSQAEGVPGVLIEPYGAVGKILFLNSANGATLSTFSPGSWPEGEVTVSNGIVYVSLNNGNLLALGQ